MKYERCPNCNGKLAIPDKKRGLSIECPVCELEFVPAAVDKDQTSSKSKRAEKESNVEAQASRPEKPSLRSLPVPASVAAPSKESKTSSTFKSTAPDPLLPPKRSKLGTMAPAKKGKPAKLSGPPSPPARPSPPESPASSAVSSDLSDSGAPPVETEVAETKIARTHDATRQSTGGHARGGTVAKIITSETVQPLLTKEGKLPELQLKDDVKPKQQESKLTSNPMFVGVLVCASLVLSCLMLLMLSAHPSNNQNTVESARENIRKFYEVEVDEDLKPYQIDLREAQLAHSRGDYEAEIKAYQSVMTRFRAEDRSQYTGLTGSPSWDNELEDLVSVLLNEAKRNNRSFLN